MSSAGGRLRVTLLDGNSGSIQGSETYFIVVNLPEVAKTSSFKTDALPKEKFSSWNKTSVVELSQPLNSSMQIRLILMEYGRIKDKPVGEGVFECAELFQGQVHVVQRVSIVGSAGGSQLCDVSLDLSWDGDVPSYIPQGFGAPQTAGSPSGGQPAGSASGGARPGAPTVLAGGSGGAVAVPGLPPCEGRSFSVRVMIRKAKNLQSETDNKLYDPLVYVTVGQETQKTGVQKQNMEPIFDEELMFLVSKADANFWSLPININVMHHRLGFPDDEIGTTQLEMQSVYRYPQHIMAHKWFILRKGGMSTQIMGFLKMTIMVLDTLNDQIPEIDDDPEDGEESEDSLILNLVNTPGAQFEEVYMRCELYKADGIPQMDGATGGGKADPFVKIAYGMKNNRTSHLNNTLNPEWNTAIMVPIQKPALIDCLSLQMYDYDGIGKNKLISTVRLSVDNMKALSTEVVGKGEEGLPRQYAQYINFYGCPRSYYKEGIFNLSVAKPKFYDNMDKALKEGVDFRGRLLCRFVGSRDKECAKDPISFKPRTAFLHFAVTVQALQFSMLKKGTYTFQVSCGNGEGQPPAVSRIPKKADDMRGSSTNGLAAVFFGEEIRLEHKLEVVLPPLVESPQDFRTFVYKQLPDIFLHLYSDKTMYAVYRVKVTDVIGRDDAVLVCDTMRVLKDPEKVDEGEAPSDPLAQFYVGMSVRKIDSSNPVEMSLTPEELAVIPSGNDVRFKGIAMGEPEKWIVEACIHRGMNFPVGDSNGLSDPFVRICWANSTAQSGVQLETLNPTFEELVLLRADTRQPFTNIVVELWDWDLIGSNTFLAKAVVHSKYGLTEAGEKIWLSNFTDSRGKPVDARLLVSFEIQKDVGQKYATKVFQKRPGRSETYTGLDIPDLKKLVLKPHTITVSALMLRKMRPFRMLDVKHSQVTVSIGNTVIEFEKRKGINPDINQQKTLVMDLPENAGFWPNLSVAVFDHRQLGSKPRVGVASVSLTEIAKDKDGQRVVMNLYHPKAKEEKKRIADEQLEQRLLGIARWKREAFGDPTAFAANATGAASDVFSPVSPMNLQSQDLQANLSIAIEQKKKEKRRKKQSRQSTAGFASEAELGDYEDDVELEDSSNELSEAEIALKVVKDKQDALFVDRQDRANDDEEEKKKHEILKPTDLPWFERFDADETIANKEFIVSRLGKAHDYLSKKGVTYADVREGTAEAYFGPFADDGVRVQLNRGYTKSSSKAGELTLDISVDVCSDRAVVKVDEGTLQATQIASRQNVNFELRAYLIACRHLAAVDHSMSGSSSDPYIVLTLNSGADSGCNKADMVKMNLKEFRKQKTLNPDYYLTQQLSGDLPRHSNLLVEVFDHNDILADKLIGFTNINLEDRWHSVRGYKAKKPYMEPGMYTEKRLLRDENGQIQGSIELWLDMFARGSSIPHPIDITPPPPIEMELRTIVWATRDVVLEDISLSGEAMVDIYVRAWMNGMRHDMQSTDVHYRSLDGSGTFNWRMNFQFLFDPRSRKIMPMAKKAKTIANWFRIRREQKHYDPVIKVQIFDNSILPGNDNFIGEATLNLLKMRPVSNQRNKTGLLMEMLGDIKDVATTFLCCKCCQREPTIKDLTLEQRQLIAVKEFKEDMDKRNQMFRDEARERRIQLEALKTYTNEQLDAFEAKFLAEARAKAQINAFDAFLPSGRVKNVGKHLKAVQELPPVAETSKCWFTARGPKGAGRVGDVQLSFQLVRLDALEKDEKLAAGKGRAEPQALPDPNRPDTSYFWLTSPFKAATHILWTRYKWYILGLLLLLLLGLFIYLFLSEGIQVRAQKFFE